MAALPRTQAQAQALEAGHVYLLHIDARAPRGGKLPPSYEARFCLARQPDGGLPVRQIVPGAPSGRRAGAR